MFGHPDSILSFSEGILAKLADPGELQFFRAYNKELKKAFPPNLLPKVYGIGYMTNHEEDEYTFEFHPTLDIAADEARTPYLFQKDIIEGYQRPCIMDLKIGIRSWGLGASEKKAQRRAKRIAGGVASTLNFRLRAGLWYSENENWSKDSDISYVSRDFGNHCTVEELSTLFSDFFRDKNQIVYFINQLSQLQESLQKIHDTYGVRFYSSSILIAYDEANSQKRDLRMIDFEKAYTGIQETALKYNETIEDCEDGVITAVSNLRIKFLGLLSRLEPKDK